MKIDDYFRLGKLAQRRSYSETDYRQFQEFQAQLLLNYLREHHVVVGGKRILDLGSGVGGYSREFARYAAQVVSVDLVQPLDPSLASVAQLKASASAIPLLDETVDLVFCASLVEHMAHPQEVLAETKRVLCPGGVAYFSFPPYYSPLGGHEYAPFHYLGEGIALRLVRHKAILPKWVAQMHRATDAPQTFANLYESWGLYKMTIRKFRSLIKASGLTCLDLSTRYLPVSFIRWPIIGEVLTWHAQFLLNKPSCLDT